VRCHPRQPHSWRIGKRIVDTTASAAGCVLATRGRDVRVVAEGQEGTHLAPAYAITVRAQCNGPTPAFAGTGGPGGLRAPLTV
jgi:hypothetical protein